MATISKQLHDLATGAMWAKTSLPRCAMYVQFREFENNDLKSTTYEAIFQPSRVAHDHGYPSATKETKAHFQLMRKVVLLVLGG